MLVRFLGCDAELSVERTMKAKRQTIKMSIKTSFTTFEVISGHLPHLARPDKE
jgi:hypothetical protein